MEDNKQDKLTAQQKYYQANKERLNAKAKKYYNDNKEKIKEYRNTDDFKSRDKEHQQKYYQANKEKLNAKSREYYHDNKEKVKVYQDKYNEKNKDRIIAKRYGLTKEEYKQMFVDRNHQCDMCGMEENGKKLSVDHNHITGEVRGLLCQRCNTGIGTLRTDETLDILKEAICYLEKTDSKYRKDI